MRVKVTSSLFLTACELKPTETTPVWFMRQAGRYLSQYRKIREKYDLLSMCKIPELAAEVTLMPVKILGVDAAILFSDLLLPLEPMGIPIHFSEKKGPVLDNPIRTAEDVKALKQVDLKKSLGYVFSAILHAKDQLPRNIPLLGFAGAPFTLASYLLEGGHSQNFLKTKSFMYHEPLAWKELMAKLAHLVSDYLSLQIDAGADAVQIFDSWAGVLSPDDYREFVLPYSASIFRHLSRKKVPLIHFATGSAGILPLIRDAGGSIISVDWRIRLDEAWRMIGHDKGVQGNLDPAALFAPLPILKKELQAVLVQASGRPGYIFNLGHGILPGTPVDHVKAVVNWVKTFNFNQHDRIA